MSVSHPTGNFPSLSDIETGLCTDNEGCSLLSVIDWFLYGDWGLSYLPNLPDNRTNYAIVKFGRTQYVSKKDQDNARHGYTYVIPSSETDDVLTIGTFVVILGGVDEHGTVLSSVLIMNTSDPHPEWRYLQNMPEPRMLHNACATDKVIYVSGGKNEHHQTNYLSSVVYLDTKGENPEWKHLIDMPEGRVKHAMWLRDKGFMIFGGYGDHHRKLDNTCMYLDLSNPNPTWDLNYAMLFVQENELTSVARHQLNYAAQSL